MCQSTGPCVYMMPNLSTSKNHVIRVKPSVNFICCIKHTARCCWYNGAKARQIWQPSANYRYATCNK